VEKTSFPLGLLSLPKTDVGREKRVPAELPYPEVEEAICSADVREKRRPRGGDGNQAVKIGTDETESIRKPSTKARNKTSPRHIWEAGGASLRSRRRGSEKG